MKVKRGDIVLVNYPFASGTGGKIRPALVVQCDRNNSRLDNTVIAQVTGRIRYVHQEPTQFLVEVASGAGQQTGLLSDSAVSCENLFTIRQDTILRKIGKMPEPELSEIDECLKAALGLE
ncbi:MAG: type II toxin-antitoxin system PemK/MazF family toxin [Planctomycetota bacterium]|nr:type II toxin-antitoxin system PemK/MazF family toxin [Planctomycetota bacterium]